VDYIVDNELVSVFSQAPAITMVRAREHTFITTEVWSVDEVPAAGYLQVEFPSECWNFPKVATLVTHSLERFFVEKLPHDPRDEHVYWDSEDDVLKIWTIIPEPDFELEEPIYAAQMAFMDRFPRYQCDFSVIYRFGKPLDDVSPQGARLIL
jgi:hypothetical protein